MIELYPLLLCWIAPGRYLDPKKSLEAQFPYPSPVSHIVNHSEYCPMMISDLTHDSICLMGLETDRVIMDSDISESLNKPAYTQ